VSTSPTAACRRYALSPLRLIHAPRNTEDSLIIFSSEFSPHSFNFLHRPVNMADRPKTPPRGSHSGNLPPNPLTPEQIRRTVRFATPSPNFVLVSLTSLSLDRKKPVSGPKPSELNMMLPVPPHPGPLWAKNDHIPRYQRHYLPMSATAPQ
jgi:hypothetical protein